MGSIPTGQRGDFCGAKKAWRAVPFGAERMMPLSDRQTEGRVNPKGIPCLYLSTNGNTAMSEVRPWVGSRLSLAQFQIRKSLTLVDCSSDEEEAWYDYGRLEGKPKQREKATWAAIN